MNKICYRCKVEKDVNQFFKQKSKKDGYNIYCKGCCKLVQDNYSNNYRFNYKLSTCKICTKCLVEKPVNDFNRSRLQKDGFNVQCKKCSLERVRAWRASLPLNTHITSKLCSRCEELKNVTEFYKDKILKDGYSSQCKACHKIKALNYKSKNIKKFYETTSNPDIKEKKCLKCKETKSLLDFTTNRRSKDGYNGVCKKCAFKNSYFKTQNIKLKVFTAYGNKCVNCSETDYDVLTIDHINNDGNLDRRGKSRLSGDYTYRKLIKLGFPKEDYQILCYNCNIKKYKNFLREKMK